MSMRQKILKQMKSILFKSCKDPSIKLKDIVLTSSFFPEEPINSKVAIPLHLKFVVLLFAMAKEVLIVNITSIKIHLIFLVIV